MKRIFLISIVALLVIASSESIAGDPKSPLSNKPSSAVASPTAESLRAQNAALIEKMARNQDEAHKRSLDMMTSTEKDIARHEQDATRVEKDIARQEQDMARFEKILDTWERQQAQYQKYLDSLPTSKGRK
jgi:septal ring factor EnvC (AmiA/AmiB activator)